MANYRLISLCLLWLLTIGLPVLVYGEEVNSEATNAPQSDQQGQEQAAEEQVRFVNDNLVIMMRAGNSSKHKIVRHIPAGTELKLLEASEKYSRVVTRRGTEGWVLNQYITPEPIARHKLKTANQNLTRLKAQNEQLKKELLATTQQNAKLTTSTNKMTDQLQNFRSVAAKPIQLQEQNTALIEEKVSLESENEMMEQEIQVLRDHSDKQWFLAGAGVLLFGIFLGLVIPRLRKRRKSDWSSL